jgi:hypothetical protein
MKLYEIIWNYMKMNVNNLIYLEKKLTLWFFYFFTNAFKVLTCIIYEI